MKPEMMMRAGVSDHLSILSEERIMPEQFLGSIRPQSPEQKMYLAILEDAINDYKRKAVVTAPHRNGRLAKEYREQKRNSFHDDALEWFEGAQAKVTFDEVCTALRIEPGYFLRLLRRTPIGKLGTHRRSGWDKRERVLAA